ncbi:MAG: amidohydrolase family protein [Clostridia bacterium]|nr:amidohydrolase family protein [Clostridia bacterium]
MQDIIIKNGKVLFFEANNVVIKNKEILIQEGKIAKIQDKIEKNDAYLLNANNCIVMPGLINTHAHIPMSIFRESTEGCKLYDWLHKEIWPREEKLTKEDIYYASMLSFIEMISTGTTCINDQYFMPEQIRDAAKEAKVRAVLTRPLMDTDNTLETRIEEFKKFYETRQKENDLITYTVAPHGLYTCTGKCLEKAAALAKEYHIPVHIHFLESIDEIEDIKNLHAKPAAQVLKQYFSDVHTILAHGVKITDEDIEILKTMDCGIAHNPISNLRLGCKIADTTKYLKQGLNVALRNRRTRIRKQFRHV